jgi:hypothetical protein
MPNGHSQIRLLALSFYYPPANNPRAVQVDRLLRNVHLPTTLVCAAYNERNDRMDHARGSETATFVEDCVRVLYTETAWQKLTDRISHRFDLVLVNKRPDKFLNWKPAVVKAVDQLMRNRVDKPNVLVTFGSPMSDHVIGLELKQRFRLPWLAHFSDPWVDNIFKNYDWLTRLVNVSLEKKVVQTADRLIFTSDETLDLVMAKYPSAYHQKARVLPHAFEILTDAPATREQSSNIGIRYIGDMYGQRTPRPLFSALKKILVAEPDLLNGVSFEFVGSMHDLKLDEMGLSELPYGLVGFRPTVSYAESLMLMGSADGLLVIDAPAATSVFLPSKLIDYIGAGKPILGITPPGTAAKLITELGGWVSDPSDVESTQNALTDFIHYIRQNRAGACEWGEPNVRSRFGAEAVARKFEGFVAELGVGASDSQKEPRLEKMETLID